MTREEQAQKLNQITEAAKAVFVALAKWEEEGSCVNEADCALAAAFIAYKKLFEEVEAG